MSRYSHCEKGLWGLKESKENRHLLQGDMTKTSIQDNLYELTVRRRVRFYSCIMRTSSNMARKPWISLATDSALSVAKTPTFLFTIFLVITSVSFSSSVFIAPLKCRRANQNGTLNTQRTNNYRVLYTKISMTNAISGLPLILQGKIPWFSLIFSVKSYSFPPEISWHSYNP